MSFGHLTWREIPVFCGEILWIYEWAWVRKKRCLFAARRQHRLLSARVPGVKQLGTQVFVQKLGSTNSFPLPEAIRLSMAIIGRSSESGCKALQLCRHCRRLLPWKKQQTRGPTKVGSFFAFLIHFGVSTENRCFAYIYIYIGVTNMIEQWKSVKYEDLWGRYDMIWPAKRSHQEITIQAPKDLHESPAITRDSCKVCNVWGPQDSQLVIWNYSNIVYSLEGLGLGHIYQYHTYN